MLAQINVLLAIRPQAIRESLRRSIQSQQDMVVVGEVLEPVEILLATSRAQADVVVLDLPEDNVDPGICSHLLSEYPHILILALSPDREQAVIYRHRVSKKHVSAESNISIISAIREAKMAEA